MSAEDIMVNFKKAYPNDTIVAYKFKSGGRGSFSGEKLLNVTLNDGYTLRIYKLRKSSGAHVNADEIKVKAFPFVYESRNMIDTAQRRDILNNKLTSMFPNHNVTVFIFNDSNWSRQSNNTKGITYFEKGYGSEVDVILS
jgi:hypothetical protein